ncbi:mandelate racemase/muconate lactonizing enzyme family protein [Plantactinospora sp. BB1]|uniref:mandelate racemase/muconate lactonizing enzyme family protein n=1 Tax=Plantactinospora sp. BB1 TaxID=2071627 RepID=UPI000D156650|nr:enolase C-terminal domain-like protein [Plantactinospora sp. BB1]AVT38301.1 hypothetical protein C6W10_19745 [Plantactinospora sp. BB1]
MITSISAVVREIKLTQTQMRGLQPVNGVQESVFLQVTDDAGHHGYGEASAWSVFSEQTPQAIVEVVTGLLAPALIGRDPTDRAGASRAMDAAVPGNAVAKAALDMAIHDLVGRATGLAVHTLLGGDPGFAIDLSYSVSRPDPASVDRVVRERADDGYRIFKLKVGALSPAEDVERLRALRRAAPDAALRLDYNQRGTETALRAILGTARDSGVEFCEQPFRARQLDRLARLRGWFDVPISVDEGVSTAEDLEPVARAGLCDVVAVKFGRSGGTKQTIELFQSAQRHGLAVYCGSLNETRLGVGAAMQAYSLAGDLVSGSDFYFPYEVLDDGDVRGGPRREGARVLLPEGPGHGATVPAEWFAESSARTVRG